MRNDHPAAAVSLKSEVIEDLLRVLSHSDTFDVLGVGGADDFAARETPDGNDHAITSPV